MNIDVHGPKILFEIPVLGGIKVSETIVNMWIIMAVITLVCFFLGRNLRVKNPSKRQLVAEKAVLMITSMVTGVMGNLFDDTGHQDKVPRLWRLAQGLCRAGCGNDPHEHHQ